jgi:hypothetical protein
MLLLLLAQALQLIHSHAHTGVRRLCAGRSGGRERAQAGQRRARG